MTVKNPADFQVQWEQNFAAGNLAGLVDLYTPDSIVVPEPGTHVQGLAGIEAAIKVFIDMRPATLSIDESAVVVNGDTAVSYSPWRGTFTGPEGDLPLEGVATVVFHQGPDGWDVVIDDFWSKG